MAEIGAALREARTRARIEIAQMEAQTKIRAKYLRALENEEWELLPGPTYVKSFLRTYGDMLGIDGRQLVAEYKSAHEPFQASDELGQISKHTGGRMNRQQSPSPLIRLGGLGLLAALVIAGGAYAVISRGDNGTDATATTPAGTPAAVDDSGTPAADTPASDEVASVVLTATDDVTVCVRAGKRIIVATDDLKAGEKTKVARGRTLIVTVTNRKVQMRVNGKREALPASDGAVTMRVTATAVRLAPASTTGCRA